MSHAIIYSRPNCVWCDRAKEKLADHNVPFTEHNILVDTEARAQWFKLIEGQEQTVPQIILDGEHVGGFKGLEKVLG